MAAAAAVTCRKCGSHRLREIAGVVECMNCMIQRSSITANATAFEAARSRFESLGRCQYEEVLNANAT